MVGRRLASALSRRCFPAGHHQLQHPPPTADPAVPSSPSNDAVVQAPPLKVRMYSEVFVCEKTYRTGRAGDLGAGIVKHFSFKSPMYRAFPTTADHADRAVGPLSPLPCHAWHGYGVSSAHHGEVRGCRAYERTPLRGRRRCAAGGRQVSNSFVSVLIVIGHLTRMAHFLPSTRA
jgi:hypothetical protein